MIEVSKVHYDVIAITEKKVQLNITQAVEGLGWEEEEDELAMKITFLINGSTDNIRIENDEYPYTENVEAKGAK